MNNIIYNNTLIITLVDSIKKCTQNRFVSYNQIHNSLINILNNIL